MMPAAIHVDLSEIIAHPLRTGIQRIVRQAIRHWPGPAALVACRVDEQGRLLRLPGAVLDRLCADDDGTEAAREAERQALHALAAAAEPMAAGEVRRLLNLELFFGVPRANAHLRSAAEGVRVLWYVYDFLPFLRPDLFNGGTTRHCMHFLRALRGAQALAFLSDQTRQEFASRVARVARPQDSGPVFHPGADGLGLERQAFSADRRDFVALGTVEQRKNTPALLRAFESLWDAGANVRLIVAGRLSPEATEALAFFARHADDPRLVVLEQPADETVRHLLRGARAIVMPSEAEGFGLPPYEALHAGIPAIASKHLPSAAMLPAGAILLERMESAAIAAAVASLLDDTAAARLWAAAGTVRLPTWAAFGRGLGEWAQAA